MSNEWEKYKDSIDFKRLRSLVEVYKQKAQTGEIKRYNEEQTKNDFIRQLFRALGWNTENNPNKNDRMKMEEGVNGKRADFEFSINDIPKVYVEAKSLKEEGIGFKQEYQWQAVNYAWLKSCSWAILTNFKTLIVYNADTPEGVWGYTLDIVNDFESRAEKLYYISKNGFESNALDEWAENEGKKPQKISVDKQLLSDLIHFRSVLSSDIQKNNQDKHLTQDELDEAVQRTLDRLIFIRNAEDRGLENRELSSNFRQWAEKERGNLIKRVRELYQEYKKSYNSGLFGKDDDKHISDQVQISNDALTEVIQGLYSPVGSHYAYDFSLIEADVLGKMYEQYLGNILKQTAKRAKLSESRTHRKEQGIYYTPSYIVDYIVKKTVGEYLKTHTPEEIEKVRILDPACGSGSFLIRAYQELENYWDGYYANIKGAKKSSKTVLQGRLEAEFEKYGFYNMKAKILLNNIFGVDLDPKAVEIARLNLLLKISEKKQKLPLLQGNIKVGNSLIESGEMSSKAFNWEKEFPEAIQNGGFDIVLGNPPWVFTRGENFTEEEKQVYSAFLKDSGVLQDKKGKNIQSGKLNLYALFLVKALKLSKENGQVSFIVPNNILRTTVYDSVRRFILQNSVIEELVDLSSGVFDQVTASSIVMTLSKNSSESVRDQNLVRVVHNVENLKTNSYDVNKTQQGAYLENTSYAMDIKLDQKEQNLIKKIVANSTQLGSYTKYIIEGIVGSLDRDVFNSKVDDRYKPFLIGKDIGRYSINFKGRFILYDRKRLHRARPEEVFTSKKIIMQRISGGKWPLKGCVDGHKFYTFASINNIILYKNDAIDYEYLIALLNSKLFNWYYAKKFTNASDLTVNISRTYLEELPIREGDEENRLVIHQLVSEILNLNAELAKERLKYTDDTKRKELRVAEIDDRIDKIVYGIYGLSQDQTTIIEKFFED